MKVTISDIARMAGVSKATVSRVINNKSKGVGEETKSRILKIIDEVGYLPNTLARSIVVSKTRTLGLIIPDIDNPFFPQMVRGVVRYARNCGYTVFLCNSDNNQELEDASIMSLIEKRVDGVALISSARTAGRGFANLQKYSVPVVQLDRVVGGRSAGASVVIDNRGGMYAATAHFLDAGHTKIAFLGGTKGVYTTIERYKGFRDAIEDHGLSLDDVYVDYGHYDIASGITMTKELLEQKPDVTAIIAGCDLIGIGAIKACRQHGVSIPEQVEIIGFDGIAMAEVVEPTLSTVVQPVQEVAEEAAKLLIGIIDGEVSSNRRLVIEPELVLRGSTKREI